MHLVSLIVLLDFIPLSLSTSHNYRRSLIWRANSNDCVPNPPGDAYRSIPLASGQRWCDGTTTGSSSESQHQASSTASSSIGDVIGNRTAEASGSSTDGNQTSSSHPSGTTDSVRSKKSSSTCRSKGPKGPLRRPGKAPPIEVASGNRTSGSASTSGTPAGSNSPLSTGSSSHSDSSESQSNNNTLPLTTSSNDTQPADHDTTTTTQLPDTQSNNTTQSSGNTEAASQFSSSNETTTNPLPKLAPRRTMQATVTGYADCTTAPMACGFLPLSPHSPTAAMSAYLIPHAASGTCGTCWRITNATALTNFGSSSPSDTTIPVKSGPLKTATEGMVVTINNSCARYEESFIGSCNQNETVPRDKLGSETVLDLCRGTDAVRMFFGGEEPGMAVATIEEVECGEWKGTKGKVGWS
ncbi:MAG: hypothetical protein Q9220_001156 [cf. Caloplaca sp. 1 TL-2023]